MTSSYQLADVCYIRLIESRLRSLAPSSTGRIQGSYGNRAPPRATLVRRHQGGVIHWTRFCVYIIVTRPTLRVAQRRPRSCSDQRDIHAFSLCSLVKEPSFYVRIASPSSEAHLRTNSLMVETVVSFRLRVQEDMIVAIRRPLHSPLPSRTTHTSSNGHLLPAVSPSVNLRSPTRDEFRPTYYCAHSIPVPP